MDSVEEQLRDFWLTLKWIPAPRCIEVSPDFYTELEKVGALPANLVVNEDYQEYGYVFVYGNYKEL